MSKVYETGILELIGVDDPEVASGEVSGSVEAPLAKDGSGEILSVLLVATENGTGAVLTPAGKLLIFDADPNPTAGDADLAAAEWPTVIGAVPVDVADWIADANGAVAFIIDTPVPFHHLSALYFVWLHEDATPFNSAAGDNEQLEINAWYRLEP